MTHGRIWQENVFSGKSELKRQQDDILGRRWYWIHWAITQVGKTGTGPLSDL